MAGGTKEELLMKLKVSDLKLIAKEKNIKIAGKDDGYLGFGILKRGKIKQPTKDDFIDSLLASNRVTKQFLIDFIDQGLNVAYSKKSRPSRVSLTTSNIAQIIDKEYKLEKAHSKEAEFERDFYNWCNGRFGTENVTKQIGIGNYRIDVQVGDIGIELKLPKTSRQLLTLRGQVDEYSKKYKNKLIILLVAPKVDSSIIQEFKKDIKKKNVMVIEKY